MTTTERNTLLRATAIVRDYNCIYDRYYPSTFIEFCEEYHNAPKQIIQKALELIR